MGLDKFIQWILDQLITLIPIITVHPYSCGVLYWKGNYVRELHTGWNWMIPYFHTFARCEKVDTTMPIPAYNVISKDNKSFIIKGTVGYNIKDANKYFNNVYDAKGAIEDRAAAIIQEYARSLKAVDMINIDTTGIFEHGIEDTLQLEVEEYGIHILFFRIMSITEGKGYRLYHETISNLN